MRFIEYHLHVVYHSTGFTLYILEPWTIWRWRIWRNCAKYMARTIFIQFWLSNTYYSYWCSEQQFTCFLESWVTSSTSPTVADPYSKPA